MKKKVYITIVNTVDQSTIQYSELYSDTDGLYLDKALGRYGIKQSDIKGSITSNSGHESPITGDYFILGGVLDGTSKIITVMVCDWKS